MTSSAETGGKRSKNGVVDASVDGSVPQVVEKRSLHVRLDYSIKRHSR